MKTILLALGVMLLAVPAYASEVSVSLGSEPEISASEGAPLPAPETAAAINGKLEAIKACFAEGNEAIDLSYRVELEVSGTGLVTGVTAPEGSPAQAPCVDAALKEIAMPPMAKPEATAKVTVIVKVARAQEEQPAAAAAVVPVAEQPAAAPVEQPPAAPSEPVATPVASDATASVATADAANEEDAKPWTVRANLNQSLGQGVFTDPAFASFGYSIVLGGTYVVDEKYASIGLKWGFDQELTTSYASGGTFDRELLPQDLAISISAPELYQDDVYTGIKATAGLAFGFPISKASRDQEQVMSSKISLGLSRAFEEVGPGTLTVSWASSVKVNFSPGSRTFADDEWYSKVHTCDHRNLDKGECLTNLANPRWSMSNGVTASYAFLEKFTVSYTFSIANAFSTRLDGSTIPVGPLRAGVPFDPDSRSKYAVDSASQADTTTSTLEFSYDVLDNLTLAAGLSTAQDPFIYHPDEPFSLRNPFWDFSSQANNFSTFYLDIGASY